MSLGWKTQHAQILQPQILRYYYIIVKREQSFTGVIKNNNWKINCSNFSLSLDLTEATLRSLTLGNYPRCYQRNPMLFLRSLKLQATLTRLNRSWVWRFGNRTLLT